MNNDKIKAEFKDKIGKYDKTIDKLPIKCFHNINMQRYVFPKLK